MSKFFLFPWIVILLNSISFVFFLLNLQVMSKWPWSEECLTLGDDVIILFARFIISGHPFVTPPRFRVIVYPFNFDLGVCWSCIGGGIGWN